MRCGTYVPLICVQPVAVDRAIVHTREDYLITDDPPCSATLLGLGELVVEPILLETTHQRATSIVLEIFDVIIVPVQRRDRAVVVACIKHDEVKELAHLEVTRDAKVVVHVDLTNAVRDISIVEVRSS